MAEGRSDHGQSFTTKVIRQIGLKELKLLQL
jgi:hypothetical protein